MQADDLINHIINSLLRLAHSCPFCITISLVSCDLRQHQYRVGAANYRQLVLAAVVGIHYICKEAEIVDWLCFIFPGAWNNCDTPCIIIQQYINYFLTLRCGKINSVKNLPEKSCTENVFLEILMVNF